MCVCVLFSDRVTQLTWGITAGGLLCMKPVTTAIKVLQSASLIWTLDHIDKESLSERLKSVYFRDCSFTAGPWSEYKRPRRSRLWGCHTPSWHTKLWPLPCCSTAGTERSVSHCSQQQGQANTHYTYLLTNKHRCELVWLITYGSYIKNNLT